jgi:peptide/nickel transport system substrate-binding protein
MNRSKKYKLMAIIGSAAVGLSVCGAATEATTASTTATYNAAISGVVRPSNATGGTIVFNNSSVPDSTDPGNTYYANMWNVIRLYGRALVTYK